MIVVAINIIKRTWFGVDAQLRPGPLFGDFFIISYSRHDVASGEYEFLS